MTKSLCVLILVAVTVAATVPMASAKSVYTDRRINQQNRVEQGIKSGELTKGEAARIESQEHRINTMRDKFLSDGSLSPEEKLKLKAAQNRESKTIYNQKHDAQERK